VSELVPADGKRWGLVATILGALPKAAAVKARNIYDWVKRGLLVAKRMAGRGKGLLVVALEDVLALELLMRTSVAKRGQKARSATA
jgi:hypothetical protein